ncbi:hypothetical protein Huta_2648 [Halorhabdus utahensis DSM 12940]|uniref:Uncharacterized protein n=1 Tax=Halorhabdus utahensis (strain DSM 12940 / JCM 11049 / AX-2) TaxID=519442 RepID=C7NQ83_HALUD|nr:hypothetical protein [Halorhabdus utahensis]ACV12809.1 hypothetical protein Huta_2648 [Halorhabdus utahensis DSM 12940]
MNLNNKLLVGSLIFVVLVVAGGSIFVFTGGIGHEEKQAPNPPPQQHTDIDFDGDISTDPRFNLTGTIEIRGIINGYPSFTNVSIRLYRDNGSIIDSRCLGTISEEQALNVSLTANELPKYVIFASPEFWTKSTVDDFQVDYFYYGNGNYLPITWTEPSDVSIDLKRHRPCQNTD